MSQATVEPTTASPNRAEEWRQLGRAWYKQGKYRKAAHAFLCSLRYARQRKSEAAPDLLGKIFVSLGIVFHLSGDSDRAERYIHEGLQDPTIPPSYQGILYLCLGNVRYQRGLDEEAVQAWEKAELILREAGDLSHMSMAMSNRGMLLIDLGDVDQALALLHEAETIKKQIGEEFLYMTETEIARAYTVKGEYEKAKRYAQKALEQAMARRDEAEVGRVLCVLAEIEHWKGKHDSAKEIFHEAFEILCRAKGVWDLHRLYGRARRLGYFENN